MPAYRIEPLRRICRWQNKAPGRWLRNDRGRAVERAEDLIEKLYKAAYTCTGCRRCMVYCPFGVDLSLIIGVEKAMLAALGRVPEELELLTETAIEKGNSVHLYRGLLRQLIGQLEPELRSITGLPEVAIPIGKKGARVLFVALEGVDRLILPSAIFNLAGEDWTLSEYEASNFGYFLGDRERASRIARRIVDEATALGVEQVAVDECGHAYRVMKHLCPGWTGGELPFQIRSVIELWDSYLQEGRIKIKQDGIKEPATYHDPCQLGRNGGIFEAPRAVIKAIVRDFREMNPNRAKNWCCGGGGGLIARSELEQFRAEAGRMKAEQIRDTGAKLVVAPCGNCRIQLALLNEYYCLGVEVVSIADLLVKSVIRD